jgi:hypothetical protein
MTNNQSIKFSVKRELVEEWEKFSNMITHKGSTFRNNFSVEICNRDTQIEDWRHRYEQFGVADKLNSWKNSKLNSQESKNFREKLVKPLRKGRELSCVYLSMEMNESADELLCVEIFGKISMKAFNPRQSKLDLSATTSAKFFQTWSLSETVEEWKNGYIESQEEKECIQFIKAHPDETAALILSKIDNDFKLTWE